MPEVCHLFVITSTDTFLRHKSYYKAVISCQKKDVAFLLSFSLKKSGPKVSKGVTEFAFSGILCQNYLEILAFPGLNYFVMLQMEGSRESPIGRNDEWGIQSKDERTKPSGRHNQKFLESLFSASAQARRNPSKSMVNKISKKHWN